MKRIDFLRQISFGVVASSSLACLKTVAATDSLDGIGSTNGSSATDCNITNAETAGPFPNKSPNKVVYSDIRLDRKGVNLKLELSIKNKNTSCGPAKDLFVDVWHCDADGAYSEYGSVANVSFLRGRQTTDTAGLVKFNTVFPGWYNGRATHIHVHVFNAAGKSLLVTQIAFPKTVCDDVFKNATNFYKKGLQDTSNERDNVFSDGFKNEMPSVIGNITDGFLLTHTIVVNA